MGQNLRRIPLNSAINLRDLGGYPTMDGKATPFGRFFRSDNMFDLTPEDMEILVKRGIRTIIDLRTPGEITNQPNCFGDHSDVQVVYCSLLGENINNFVGSGDKGFFRSLGENYATMIREGAPYYKELFDLITKGLQRGAVLFHCTAGKDRTGVTASLLLGLAGVYDVDIVADYHLTDVYLQAKVRQFMVAFPDNPPELYAAPITSMEAFLESLHEGFGTAQDYLLSIGVPQEQLDAVWADTLLSF